MSLNDVSHFATLYPKAVLEARYLMNFWIRKLYVEYVNTSCNNKSRGSLVRIRYISVRLNVDTRKVSQIIFRTTKIQGNLINPKLKGFKAPLITASAKHIPMRYCNFRTKLTCAVFFTPALHFVPRNKLECVPPFLHCQPCKAIPTKPVFHFRHQLLHPVYDFADSRKIEGYGLQCDWENLASDWELAW